MKTIRAKVCSPILMLVALVSLIGCGDSRLTEVEQLMETDVKAADSILSAMPMPTSRRDRAWYAVLKTQVDYKQYKTITSDSLILTATRYYGTHHKNYRSAMAWYSQGCVYSELNNDLGAVDAFFKAEDLFPDTLVRYYALAEKNLGTHYLNRMMLNEAKQQFVNSQINAKRLQDTKLIKYAFFHIGLCALYSEDFLLADSIFSEIIDNEMYSSSQRRIATIHLAKINMYYYHKYADAMNLINRYLEMTKGREYGPGLGVKADVFYEMMEYDSAFNYYNESMNSYDDLYSRCRNADKLSELSAIKGISEKAIYYHNLYGQLRDSIIEIEKAREIEELRFKHNEELMEETIAHKHKRFTIIGLSSLLSLSLLLFIAYTLSKSKERKRIMEKQSQLLHQEEEIRKSSIQVLQARVSELSVYNAEARLTLLELYKKRLIICRNRFSNTDSFYKLLSFKQEIESGKMNKKDKDELFEQLKLSYAESMLDIVAEIPDIKEKEILTILLRHLDLSSNQIANLFSITLVAVKQRIARLSQRAPSDFLDLFSRHA